jgi:hypothetical protein
MSISALSYNAQVARLHLGPGHLVPSVLKLGCAGFFRLLPLPSRQIAGSAAEADVAGIGHGAGRGSGRKVAGSAAEADVAGIGHGVGSGPGRKVAGSAAEADVAGIGHGVGRGPGWEIAGSAAEADVSGVGYD